MLGAGGGSASCGWIGSLSRTDKATVIRTVLVMRPARIRFSCRRHRSTCEYPTSGNVRVRMSVCVLPDACSVNLSLALLLLRAFLEPLLSRMFPSFLAGRTRHAPRASRLEVLLNIPPREVSAGQHSSACCAWHQFAISTYVCAPSSPRPPKS